MELRPLVKIRNRNRDCINPAKYSQIARYPSQRCKNGAIPQLSAEFYGPLLNQLAVRRFRRCGAAKLPLWHRRSPSQKGGRDRPIPAAAPSSTTNPQPGHLPEMARRQRHRQCGYLSRAIRLVGAPQSRPDTSGAAVLASSLVGLNLGPSVPWRTRGQSSHPGRVIARDAVSLTVSLPEQGEYVLRVRWSRYLTASNGCMRPAEDGWSRSWLNTPGTAEIEGSFASRLVDASS